MNHNRDNKPTANVMQYGGTVTNVKTIAERLKHAREAAGLTQPDLAKRSGVSQGTIGNIESGTRKQPRNLLQIAEALGVNPSWLSTGKGSMQSGQERQFDPQSRLEEAVNVLAKCLNEMSDQQRLQVAKRLNTLAKAPDSKKAMQAVLCAMQASSKEQQLDQPLSPALKKALERSPLAVESESFYPSR